MRSSLRPKTESDYRFQSSKEKVRSITKLGKPNMGRGRDRSDGAGGRPSHLLRDNGKLFFLKLRDWTGDIQIMISKAQVGDENFGLMKLIDFGDLVGIDGRLGRTNTGELTVMASHVTFLTKTLEPPPEKHAGLTDPELRQRMRYLDLTYNTDSLDTFRKRTKIIQSIRTTLAGHDFWEVEGPTLHTIAGGAAARPFTTHHNALDMPLFLRIALELHLKRLMVGGIERVYEMDASIAMRESAPSITRVHDDRTLLGLCQLRNDDGSDRTDQSRRR